MGKCFKDSTDEIKKNITISKNTAVPPSLLKRSPFLLKKNLESFPSTTRKYAQFIPIEQ
jgi:hypothetical protein